MLILVAAASAALCLTAALGLAIVHPWLLLLVLAFVLACWWRHRVNERARRVQRYDDEQIGLAIIAEAKEFRDEMEAAVEYAKQHPTDRRRPRVIRGHDLETGHDPTFRPWAGW